METDSPRLVASTPQPQSSDLDRVNNALVALKGTTQSVWIPVHELCLSDLRLLVNDTEARN